MNSTRDVSLESIQSMQKFSEQLFFQNTNGRMLPNCLFLEHKWMPLDELTGNSKEISICSKVVLMP